MSAVRRHQHEPAVLGTAHSEMRQYVLTSQRQSVTAVTCQLSTTDRLPESRYRSETTFVAGGDISITCSPGFDVETIESDGEAIQPIGGRRVIPAESQVVCEIDIVEIVVQWAWQIVRTIGLPWSRAL